MAKLKAGSTMNGIGLIDTTDSRLSNARPASDVSAWAKQSSLQASDVPSLDASKITTGIISKDRLPSIALTTTITTTDFGTLVGLYT